MSSLVRRSVSVAALIGGASLLAGQAQAAGFYIQEQSVRGLGRAFSGEAADAGPASLWWNPAAIGGAPREVYAGVFGVLPETKVDDQGSTIDRPVVPVAPVGGQPRAFGPLLNGVVPNLAVSTPVGDKFALGLSVNAPFNFTTKYSFDSWARYEAVKSRLNTVDIQMTGAWRITDAWTVALAADAQYADATLSNASPNLPTVVGGRLVIPNDAFVELSGDGWEWGWTAGVMGKIGSVDIGASYRSSLDHELDGTATFTNFLGSLAGQNGARSATATFSTPWIATLGGRWAATDQATISLQVQEVGWSEFDAIRIDLGTTQQVSPQDYDDTTTVALGVDYAFTPTVTGRAGIQYDPTPTPDGNRSPRVPDGDRLLFGVGGTFTPVENVLVDAGLAYVHFDESNINRETTFYEGTPAATPVVLAGTVEGHAVVMAVGGRWRF
ncbi:outer membrane protein transport protein [Caulobacter sp. 17J65-9]|uniref:OmpP1/FadL family transporter n=1 Tax=Caulobacter sp. 17J65-9 TaxID=2709382 RepID=UPI0032048B1B